MRHVLLRASLAPVRPPIAGRAAGLVARRGLLAQVRDLSLELLGGAPHRQDGIDVNAVRYLAEWLGLNQAGGSVTTLAGR